MTQKPHTNITTEEILNTLEQFGKPCTATGDSELSIEAMTYMLQYDIDTLIKTASVSIQKIALPISSILKT